MPYSSQRQICSFAKLGCAQMATEVTDGVGCNGRVPMLLKGLRQGTVQFFLHSIFGLTVLPCTEHGCGAYQQKEDEEGMNGTKFHGIKTLPKEEVGDEYGSNHTRQVGKQTAGDAVAILLNADRTEVDGEDVERRVCAALEHTGEVSDE